MSLWPKYVDFLRLLSPPISDPHGKAETIIICWIVCLLFPKPRISWGSVENWKISKHFLILFYCLLRIRKNGMPNFPNSDHNITNMRICFFSRLAFPKSLIIRRERKEWVELGLFFENCQLESSYMRTSHEANIPVYSICIPNPGEENIVLY